MKMKKWLDRVIRSEDWASRALRLGLEAFDREAGGASDAAGPGTIVQGKSGAGTSRVFAEPEVDSVPTFP